MKKHVFCLFALVVLSCQPTREDTSRPAGMDRAKPVLHISSKVLKLPTDSVTSVHSNCLFAYNFDNKEYLAILNRPGNQIIIYTLDDQKHYLTITPAKEGPQGVGTINGFYMTSLDSVYITPRGKRSIFLINRKADMLKAYHYGTSGELPSPNPMSLTTIPLVVEKDFIYLPALPFGNWNAYKTFDEVYVCCMVNTARNFDYKYLPMTYPSNYLAKGPVEPTYSRIKVSNRFIYSFFGDHHLYITQDHKDVKKIWAGSRYFDEFEYKPRSLDMQSYLKYMCETPYYIGIIYDPYRQVYYRITSLGNEVETDDNLALISRFVPNASVIVLDSGLQKIGEPRLPYGQFNPNSYFVAKDGLYLNENSPLNKNYNEDYIVFRLLQWQGQ